MTLDKDLISVAAGRAPADLVLKNCRIADVFTGTFIHGDIAIKNGMIAGIYQYTDEPSGAPGEGYAGKSSKDLGGRYVLPGFIDAHAHVESTMITPGEYEKKVLSYGVTTVIADPHEIANVCGEAGIEYMIGDATAGVLRFMVPSCVPATFFEHSGAVLNSADVERLLNSGKLLGLGEMMNYPGVTGLDPEVTAKLEAAGGMIDGHAPLLSGKDLNAYAAAGIKTDHECTNISEMHEKISRGMYIQMREGSLSKDLDALMPGIDDFNWRRCLFCSDDRNIEDLTTSGTINACLRKAVKFGIDPMRAIIIATLNAAECYGLSDKGAIAPGRAADLVVCGDLTFERIDEVYKAGKLQTSDVAAIRGRSRRSAIVEVYDTVKLPELTEEIFAAAFARDNRPVIGVRPHSILTEALTATEVERDGMRLSGLTVIERHGNHGTHASCRVAGYGITGGAIASSIGHDSHNVIVIGDNPADMLIAVKGLDTAGGIAVAQSGKLIAFLPLPVAGLMSEQPAYEVLAQHRKLDEAAARLKITPGLDPFLTLAFLPLPVIPMLRLTDSGLFDVSNFKFI